jgi:hypothetical protein
MITSTYLFINPFPENLLFLSFFNFLLFLTFHCLTSCENHLYNFTPISFFCVISENLNDTLLSIDPDYKFALYTEVR